MTTSSPYFTSALEILIDELQSDPRRSDCCEFCIYNLDCDYTHPRCHGERKACKLCPRCRHFERVRKC